MAELNFTENTKALYETMLELSPKPFREQTKKQLDESINSTIGEGNAITEENFMEVVKATTPKAFLPMAINVLEPMLTKK